MDDKLKAYMLDKKATMEHNLSSPRPPSSSSHTTPNKSIGKSDQNSRENSNKPPTDEFSPPRGGGGGGIPFIKEMQYERRLVPNWLLHNESEQISPPRSGQPNSFYKTVFSHKDDHFHPSPSHPSPKQSQSSHPPSYREGPPALPPAAHRFPAREFDNRYSIPPYRYGEEEERYSYHDPYSRDYPRSPPYNSRRPFTPPRYEPSFRHYESSPRFREAPSDCGPMRHHNPAISAHLREDRYRRPEFDSRSESRDFFCTDCPTRRSPDFPRFSPKESVFKPYPKQYASDEPYYKFPIRNQNECSCNCPHHPIDNDPYPISRPMRNTSLLNSSSVSSSIRQPTSFFPPALKNDVPLEPTLPPISRLTEPIFRESFPPPSPPGLRSPLLTDPRPPLSPISLPPNTIHAPSGSPPSPVFTMENFGDQDSGGRPKNPVKFEFKDFKENEYHLHNIQNGTGVSMHAIKQQKRHKRIINRALAQGLVRTRAQFDESPPLADKEDTSNHDDTKQKDATSSNSDVRRTEKEDKSRSNKRKSEEIAPSKTEGAADENEEARRAKKNSLSKSGGGDSEFEQFRSFEELRKYEAPSTPVYPDRNSKSTKPDLHCICRKPETGSMIQCNSCAEWYHFECVKMTKAMAQKMAQYLCEACVRVTATKRARIEDLIAESEEPMRTKSGGPIPSGPVSGGPTSGGPISGGPISGGLISGGLISDSPNSSSTDICPSPVATSSPKENIRLETSEEVIKPLENVWETLRSGSSDVISISSLAKQPWLDGWVTARAFALRYLNEAKSIGHEITETRKLPKQVAVRMMGAGKRNWRQAEIILAVQFLKSSELVETSTKKGTIVRQPIKTLDELITRVQTIPMSHEKNIGTMKAVEFPRSRYQLPIGEEKCKSMKD